MKSIELISLIGIGLTFMIGLLNLFITFRKRKTSFINSVTASRIKYIQDLRESISRFSALIHSYHFRVSKLSYDQLYELHKEADTLKFRIRLYLNPDDKYWDSKIMQLIDEILLKTDKDPTEKLDELITITQYLLKLEWEGAKRESEIGIMSEIEKKELYNSMYKDIKMQGVKNEKRYLLISGNGFINYWL